MFVVVGVDVRVIGCVYKILILVAGKRTQGWRRLRWRLHLVRLIAIQSTFV